MTGDLQRFVDAQDGMYDYVVRELRAGHKRSHWMWYVFPQIAGLGSSATAAHYALDSLAEARAYAAHPVLGPRLRECVQLTLAVKGKTAEQIFGFPDYLKFRSCLTLFAKAVDDVVFQQALHQYYGGEPDQKTLELLKSADD